MRRLKPGVGAAFALLLPLLALALGGAAAQQQSQPAAAVIPVIPVVPVVPVQPQSISQPQSPQLQQTTSAPPQQPQQPSMPGGSIVEPRVVPLVARPVSAAVPLGDAVYEPADQYQQQQQQSQLMSSGLSSKDKAAVMQAHKVSARPAAAGS